MMMDTGDRILRHIAQFETFSDDGAARRAAWDLSHPDPDAPAGGNAEFRRQSRLRRTILWGRLLRAIDAVRDPDFDPRRDPPSNVMLDPEDFPLSSEPADQGIFASIDALTDPGLIRKYKERKEIAAREGKRWNEQFVLHRLDTEVTAQAKDFFMSVFVRSAGSLAVIETCAQAEGWKPARLAEIRSWVTPEE
jgi:hypothetical protein